MSSSFILAFQTSIRAGMDCHGFIETAAKSFWTAGNASNRRLFNPDVADNFNAAPTRLSATLKWLRC